MWSEAVLMGQVNPMTKRKAKWKIFLLSTATATRRGHPQLDRSLFTNQSKQDTSAGEALYSVDCNLWQTDIKKYNKELLALTELREM